MKKLLEIIIIFTVITNLGIAKANYIDISENHWAKETIDFLSSQQPAIINGYPDGTFKPNKEMTREEFIKMLVVTIKGEQQPKADENWSSGYIQQARDLGIIGPEYENQVMKAKVTRLEVCQMIFNSFDNLEEQIEKIDEMILDYEIQKIFSDLSNINQETKKKIYILNQLNILKGYQDKTVGLNKTATRGELAEFIHRVFVQKESIKNFELKTNEYDKGILKTSINNIPISMMRSLTGKDKNTPLDVNVTITDFKIVKDNERQTSEYYDLFNMPEVPKEDIIIIIKFKIKNNTNLTISDDGWLRIFTDTNYDLNYMFSNLDIEAFKEKRPSNGIFIKPYEEIEGTNFFSIPENEFNKIGHIELTKEFPKYSEEHNTNTQSIILTGMRDT